MKQNVGTIDKVIRYVVAAAFIALGLLFSYWWFIPAAVALFTAIVGWCGLYSLLGINTCEVKHKKK